MKHAHDLSRAKMTDLVREGSQRKQKLLHRYIVIMQKYTPQNLTTVHFGFGWFGFKRLSLE